MADVGSRITEVCEHVFGDALREVESRLADLKLCGAHRRFAVARMGSTGSTWLAKLLNSHPDVFGYHEGIITRIAPATSYGSDEVLAFIKVLACDAMHGAYRAAGDVGSVWLSHVGALPAGTFATGLLLRHPARMLNTRLKVFPKDRSFTTINREPMHCIREIWGIDSRRCSDLDRVFLQDAFIFAGQIQWLHRVGTVIQIEKMRRLAYCERVLRQLTGVQYERELLQRLIAAPVNERSGSGRSVRRILDGFTPRQRSWYEQIFGDLIGRFGYALER